MESFKNTVLVIVDSNNEDQPIIVAQPQIAGHQGQILKERTEQIPDDMGTLCKGLITLIHSPKDLA